MLLDAFNEKLVGRDMPKAITRLAKTRIDDRQIFLLPYSWIHLFIVKFLKNYRNMYRRDLRPSQVAREKI